MNVDVQAKWDDLWRRLQLPTPGGVLERLNARYSEGHRAYHNLHHIRECLDESDRHRKLAGQPEAVEMAIWFHDAIYDPKAKNNEEASAALAGTLLRAAGCDAGWVEMVDQLILATKHDIVPADSDSKLIVDIDLSILGRETSRFDRYESAIREEYSWVPADVYGRERSRVLRMFLDRPHLYLTGEFRLKYEVTARVNLQRSLVRLAPQILR